MVKKKRPLGWKRGRRIADLADLEIAAKERRAVILPGEGWQGHKGYTPAAWAINFPGAVLLRMLREGIYLYHPDF